MSTYLMDYAKSVGSTDFVKAIVGGRFARVAGFPFASVAKMDQVMIERWNSVVEPGDEIWHLGDFAVRQSIERVALLLKTLNGRKHLVVGNNENAAVTNCDGWQSVQR